MLHNATLVLDVLATAASAEAAVDALPGQSPAAGADAAGRLSVTVSLDAVSLTEAVVRADKLLSGALPFRVLSVQIMTSAKFDRRVTDNTAVYRRP